MNTKTQSPTVFVLIGAGSTVFTPGLLRDFAGSKSFDSAEIRLVDLNPEAAEIMAAVGRRIAAEAGSNMIVEAFSDRKLALKGAHFVTCTIAVGSATSWLRDLAIPLRHGIQQTVGDSVGPGGVLRALRQIPALLEIARDIEEVAPSATLINYSNPLTANVRAVNRETNVSAVGLCHGTMSTKESISRDLGLNNDEVKAVFAGLNHLCWLLEIEKDGEDLYPLLREQVSKTKLGIDAISSGDEGLERPVSADLLDIYGYYPAPGDRHVAEFFSKYLKSARVSGELDWGLQGGLDSTHEYIGEKNDQWESLRAQASGKEPLSIGDNQEAERVVTITEAILHGPSYVELAVNIPNNGKISNLPDYAIVEVPAVIGTEGIEGVTVGDLPDSIAELLTKRAEQIEVIVDAATTRSRDKALEALLLDPLVHNITIATSILDDAILEDPENLGDFRV
jgi:alpha-galactosidase